MAANGRRGNQCTITGGERSTITGDIDSTLTGGKWCVLMGRSGSVLAAGENSELRIQWWDDPIKRSRTATAYVGEDGIEPHVKYRLNDQHQFVKVEQEVEAAP